MSLCTVTRTATVGVFFLAVITSSGCASTQESVPLAAPIVGGHCAYAQYPGTAIFTALTEEKDSFDLKFEFTFDDPQAKVRLQNPNFFHVTIANPNGPTTPDWLNSQGIVVGGQFPVIYSDAISGSCVPAYFTFPTLAGTRPW